MFLVQLIGKGVHVSVVGHGLVESGIEDAHLRQVGQQGLNGIDTLDIGGIVQGGQVIAGCELFHHLRSEEHALREFLAAVHHAVTDSVDFVEVLQYGVFAFGQDFEDELNASGMFGHRSLKLDFLAIGFIFNKGVGQTNLLDAATSDDRTVIHIIQSVFYTAASAVQN